MAARPPLRVALAGAGMVSQHHLRAWAATPDAEVVAIADPVRERAQSRCAEFGIAGHYDDAARMLDQVRPDALDIAAGHGAHRPLCAAAAERGIAILCQKPLASSLPEARAIAAEVGSRARLMIHENWRFRPWYRQTKQWVDDGSIGEPRELLLVARSSAMLLRDGRRPALERQPMLAHVPRLMIGEVLVHHLDVACHLVGDLQVVAVTTQRDLDELRGETRAELALTGSAASAAISGDFMHRSSPVAITDTARLAGTEGTIELHGNRLVLDGRNRADISLDLEDGYQRSYDAAIAHFVDALRRDLPFATPPAFHLQVLALVESAYRLALAASPTASQ